MNADDLLTPSEVAELLRSSESTLASWRHRSTDRKRRGPAWVKAEGIVRYRRGDVDEYIASIRRETTRPS